MMHDLKLSIAPLQGFYTISYVDPELRPGLTYPSPSGSMDLARRRRGLAKTAHFAGAARNITFL